MSKLNKVKERFLYLSPTVQAGWEDESTIGDFETQKLLGRGAFGKVHKATHKKTKLMYALKEIDKKNLKEGNMVDQVVNEVKIMYSLNHEYIIKLYNHFEEEKSLYLVIEFAPGGQLYQNLFRQQGQRFDEKNASRYIKQLALALEYLHKKQVIHRDIKPENILLDNDNNIKLADFGWSNFFKPDQKRATFCGTLDYLAPEMLEKNHKHDHTVDIWSLGVLTFELLTGFPPFSPRDESKGLEAIEEETKKNIKDLKFSFPKDFPVLAKDFVRRILVKEPSQRMSIKEVLLHAWILNNTGPASPERSYEKLESKSIKKHEDESAKFEAFTTEEIYNYSRADSIINKDYNEDFKSKCNYDVTMDGVIKIKDKDDFKSIMIESLNAKVKTLEEKITDQDLLLKKKTEDFDNLKSSFASGKETDKSREITRWMEKYENKSNEYEDLWRQFKEREGVLKDLQKKLDESNKKLDQANNKVTKLSSEIKNLKSRTEETEDQDIGDKFDDYLENLKKKHKEELETLKLSGGYKK